MRDLANSQQELPPQRPPTVSIPDRTGSGNQGDKTQAASNNALRVSRRAVEASPEQEINPSDGTQTLLARPAFAGWLCDEISKKKEKVPPELRCPTSSWWQIAADVTDFLYIRGICPRRCLATAALAALAFFLCCSFRELIPSGMLWLPASAFAVRRLLVEFSCSGDMPVDSPSRNAELALLEGPLCF